MAKKDTLRVPDSMRAIFDSIVSLTDAFCLAHLDQEYAGLARKMTAKLARKRPSPLVNGRPGSWAAGIVYALGQVNFLFSKSESPHIRADALCKLFDVSPATASGRANQIRKMLRVYQFDPEWSLQKNIDRSPFSWLHNEALILVDPGEVSPEVLEELVRLGLIRIEPDLLEGGDPKGF